MDIKVLRIKEVGGTGFSVLVSNGEVERGYTFPLNQGWEEEINGEPKYITRIREDLKSQAEILAKKATVLPTVKAHEGTVFKEKK